MVDTPHDERGRQASVDNTEWFDCIQVHDWLGLEIPLWVSTKDENDLSEMALAFGYL